MRQKRDRAKVVNVKLRTSIDDLLEIAGEDDLLSLISSAMACRHIAGMAIELLSKATNTPQEVLGAVFEKDAYNMVFMHLQKTPNARVVVNLKTPDGDVSIIVKGEGSKDGNI